ncbi:MAG: TetR/AcrR family transcriptional regulator [Candidatus Binatia bacterium]
MKDTRANAAVRSLGDVRARRAERKREEILRAGLKVFAEKGFQAATMDDIALELEATKGLLYYHFKTKEDLLQAILANNALTAGLDRVFGGLDEVSPREALATIARRFVELMQSNRELVRFIHVQALLSRAEAELVYTAVLDRLYRGGAQVLEKQKRRGRIRPDVDALELARAIASLLISHVLQGEIFGPRGEAGPNYLEQVVEVLSRGIEGPAPERRRR